MAARVRRGADDAASAAGPEARPPRRLRIQWRIRWRLPWRYATTRATLPTTQEAPDLKMTLDQLAMNLGLSTSTVSRALNGKGRMAQDTRERIRRAAHQSGYLPDQAAQELRRRSGHTIGISLTDGGFSPYFTLFWRALTQVAGERGTRFIDMRAPFDSYAHLPDAVIVHNTDHAAERLQALARRQVPAVLLGHQRGAAFVVPDDVAGARAATAHLLELGHRRIVYVGMVTEQQSDVDRRLGYRMAMAAAGLAPDPAYELDGAFSVLGAYRAVRRVVESGLPFSAIFCASDEMAVGAIGALEDLGLAVPRQVSVVGFDGLPGLAYERRWCRISN